MTDKEIKELIISPEATIAKVNKLRAEVESGEGTDNDLDCITTLERAISYFYHLRDGKSIGDVVDGPLYARIEKAWKR